MKKILSLVLVLVMVLAVLPVKAQAKVPDFRPLDIGDHTYREVESNDSPSLADVIRNDYTVVGSLSPYDLIDYFYFEVNSYSNVVIPMIAQYSSMLYGVFDVYDECVAAGVFYEYTDDYDSFFMLDTYLYAGEYYLVVMDDDAYYNDYTFYIEISGSGSSHSHSYSYDYTVYPTCTEGGYDVYSCSCGDSYTTNSTSATGHDWDNGVVITEPTATSSGLRRYTCYNCGATEDETIPATGGSDPTDPDDHPDVGDIVFNEVENNNSTGMADTIGNYYTVNAGLTTSDLIDFFRFTLEEESEVLVVTLAQYDSLMMGIMDTSEEFLAAATYDGRSDNGKSYFVMDATLPAGTYYIVVMDEDDYYNSYTYFIEWTPVGGGHTHSYTEVITPPTCTEDGFTTYTCSCGDSYVADEVPALGHNFSNGSCTRCGAADPNYVDPNGNPFHDVKESDYFYNPVLWAVENGITSGLNATTFGPNNPCTRAQVVTFLWRAAGQPEPTSTNNPFTDVSSGDYFYKPVLWAVENGITSGMSATTFGPNNTCTRGQVVTFLWRAAGQPAPASNENPFGDVAEADYFYNPVLWAVENGITAGLNATTFGAGNPCTRGQVVTFLFRADGVETPDEPDEPDEPTTPPTEPEPSVPGVDEYPSELPGWEPGTESGYYACPYVPDFGAFVGVVPSSITTTANSATFVYKTSEVNASAGTNALMDYISLLEDWGFYPAGTDNGYIRYDSGGDVQIKLSATSEATRENITLTIYEYSFGHTYAGDGAFAEKAYESCILVPDFGAAFDVAPSYMTVDDDSAYYIYDLDEADSGALDDYMNLLANDCEFYIITQGSNGMVFQHDHMEVSVFYAASYSSSGNYAFVKIFGEDYTGTSEPDEPDEPTEPTVPPTEPEEPDLPDVDFYANNPAVPDLGAVANASLMMGGDEGAYYYSMYDVSDAEMSAYKELLEACGFVFQKTTYGTIIDFDYDTYKHSTMDITVDVGYWKGNPLGNLAVVEVEGSDAGKAPSGGGSTEPGLQYYPNATVVPDFGAWAGVELADEYGIYNGVCYNYSIELTDELSTDYISLLLEEGFTVQFAFENEMSDYQVFWHPDEDLSVEFGTSLHPEWGWVTFVSVYVGDPRDPGYYGYEDYPAVPDFGSYAGAILMADPASTKGDGTCYMYDISLYEEWEQSYYELLVDKGFDVQYYTEDTDYYYEVFWHPDADLTVEFGKINDPERGWVTFVEVYAGDPAEPDHYGPAPEEPTEPESDPLNPDPDDVPAYLTYTGYGDEIITGIELPAGEWYCEYHNPTDHYFKIKFYYGYGEYDWTTLASESRPGTGQSFLEDTVNMAVSDGMLEVTSAGEWTIHFKRVSGTTTTNLRGTGDIVTGRFTATSSRALFNISSPTDSYFRVKIYQSGGGKYDWETLVSESNPYSGTVTEFLEVGEEYFFVVTCDGEWTIDMGQGDALTTYVQPDGVGGTGGGSNPGGGDNPGGGGSGTLVGYDACPAIPDFGALVGVEPEWNSILDTSCSYTYMSSKVYAAAGSDAVTNYLNLLRDMGFYLAGGYASTVIYKNDTLDLTVSVGATTISNGVEYLTIMIYGDGYPG